MEDNKSSQSGPSASAILLIAACVACLGSVIGSTMGSLVVSIFSAAVGFVLVIYGVYVMMKSRKRG